MSQEASEGPKEVVLKRQYCVGCGLCIKVVPEYFHLVDDNITIKIATVTPEKTGDLEMIIEKCPGNAIDIG